MQALESARLSLADFRVRSGFACAAGDGRPRRKDIVNVLKTVFWFFSLQRETGLRTAYALERFFEPDAFRSNEEGDRFHGSKWGRYRVGLSEPRSVLNAVDAKCPGANACLMTPLWPALTARALKRRQLEALLQRIAPRVRSLVDGHLAALRAKQTLNWRMEGRLASALERQASLDVLAAAVLLLRLAHAEGRTAAALQWGRHVLRLMLMLGELLQAGGIAQALFDLIEERVMPLAQHEGLQPGFPVGSYHGLCQLYAKALWHIKGHPFETMTKNRQHVFGQRILDNRYGYDYFYALNPIRVKVGASRVPAREQLFATPDVWLFTWAHNMLSIGGHRYPPAPDVRTGCDLWAMRQVPAAESPS